MSYQIGFSQTRRSGDYHHDNRFFLSFSLPLSDTGRTLLSTTVNVSDKNSNSIQSSISGVSGDDNQLSYGVSLNTQENGPTGYAVNGSYRTRWPPCRPRQVMTVAITVRYLLYPGRSWRIRLV